MSPMTISCKVHQLVLVTLTALASVRYVDCVSTPMHVEGGAKATLQISANGAVEAATRPGKTAAHLPGARSSRASVIRRQQPRSASDAFPAPFLQIASFLETSADSPSVPLQPATGASAASNASQKAESPAAVGNDTQVAAAKPAVVSGAVVPANIRNATQAAVNGSLEAVPAGSAVANASATTVAAIGLTNATETHLNSSEAANLQGEMTAVRLASNATMEAAFTYRTAPAAKADKTATSSSTPTAQSQSAAEQQKPLDITAPEKAFATPTEVANASGSVKVEQVEDLSVSGPRRSSAINVLLFGFSSMVMLAMLAACALMLLRPNYAMSKQTFLRSGPSSASQAGTRREGSGRFTPTPSGSGLRTPQSYGPPAQAKAPGEMLPPALASAVSAAAAAASKGRLMTSESESCI